MTLEEAITILTDLLGEGPQFSPDLRRQAVKLGIEALKDMNAERTIYHFTRHVRMTGETDK